MGDRLIGKMYYFVIIGDWLIGGINYFLNKFRLMFDDANFEREIHQSAVVKICLGQTNTFWKPVWLFRQCALNTCMFLFRISLLIHMKKSLQVLEKLKTHSILSNIFFLAYN